MTTSTSGKNSDVAPEAAAAPFGRPLRVVKIVSAALVVLALMAATCQRNEVWRSLLSLWRDAALKSPLKSRTHNNLGNCYMLLGRPFDAIPQYERAIELDPRNIEAYYNAAINLDDVGMFSKALPYYEVFCKTKTRTYAAAREKACRRFEELKGMSR